MKLILLLALSGHLNLQTLNALRAYRKVFRGKSWCERHLIADMPPELEELERQLDAEEDARWREREK